MIFRNLLELFNVNLIRCKKKNNLEASLPPYFLVQNFLNGSGRFTKMVQKNNKSEIRQKSELLQAWVYIFVLFK